MSAPDAYGWMPIETAPKNWSDVLLHVPDLDSDWRTACEGYFDCEHADWRSPVFGAVTPTHWQPFPGQPVTL